MQTASASFWHTCEKALRQSDALANMHAAEPTNLLLDTFLDRQLVHGLHCVAPIVSEK